MRIFSSKEASCSSLILSNTRTININLGGEWNNQRHGKICMVIAVKNRLCACLRLMRSSKVTWYLNFKLQYDTSIWNKKPFECKKKKHSPRHTQKDHSFLCSSTTCTQCCYTKSHRTLTNKCVMLISVHPENHFFFVCSFLASVLSMLSNVDIIQFESCSITSNLTE